MNLTALQSWTVATINERPFIHLTNGFSASDSPTLDCSRLPLDAQKFLGGSNYVAILQTNEGQQYIELDSDVDEKFFVLGSSNLSFPTNEYWGEKIVPGIYLNYRTR